MANMDPEEGSCQCSCGRCMAPAEPTSGGWTRQEVVDGLHGADGPPCNLCATEEPCKCNEEGELFIYGEPMGFVTNFKMEFVPPAPDDDMTAVSFVNETVEVSGTFTFALNSPREARRLRYKMGDAPSWQYPRWL